MQTVKENAVKKQICLRTWSLSNAGAYYSLSLPVLVKINKNKLPLNHSDVFNPDLAPFIMGDRKKSSELTCCAC